MVTTLARVGLAAGACLELRSHSLPAAAVVSELLTHHLALVEPTAHSPLIYELADQTGRLPPSNSTLVSASENVAVWRSDEAFWLRAGGSSVEVLPVHGTARLELATDFASLTAAARRDLVIQPLVMLLRERRLFVLHASGAQRHDTGVLIVGSSGSGKTSSTLSLLSSGWRYLGDDLVALATGVNGLVEAHALRRTMTCDPATVRRFGLVPPAGLWGGAGTLPFDVEGEPGRLVNQFTPTTILFPRVTTDTLSGLVALDAGATTVRIVSAMGGSMTDAAWGRRHLESAAHLAGQTTGYELVLGEDALADSGRVGELLLSAGIG